MSRSGAIQSLAWISFPRVSGDEPKLPLIQPKAAEFSPRERG